MGPTCQCGQRYWLAHVANDNWLQVWQMVPGCQHCKWNLVANIANVNDFANVANGTDFPILSMELNCKYGNHDWLANVSNVTDLQTFQITIDYKYRNCDWHATKESPNDRVDPSSSQKESLNYLVYPSSPKRVAKWQIGPQPSSPQRESLNHRIDPSRPKRSR